MKWETSLIRYLELKTLLSIIMAMAIKVMQANRGFLLLREKGGDLKPVATHALTPAEARPLIAKPLWIRF